MLGGGDVGNRVAVRAANSMTRPTRAHRSFGHARDRRSAEEGWNVQMATKVRPWTLEEVHRLPDDGNKYELVRGELFVTAGAHGRSRDDSRPPIESWSLRSSPPTVSASCTIRARSCDSRAPRSSRISWSDGHRPA